MFLKKMINNIARRTRHRLGRALYMKSLGIGPNDMKSNGEFLVQTCVLEAFLNTKKPDYPLVVFDVGANVGDWSSAFLTLLAAYKINEDLVNLYTFEPVPTTSVLLHQKLGDQHACLHYETFALSSEKGETTIYVGEGSGINSLHPNPMRKAEHPIVIHRTTATEFCKSQNIEHIHLLKCDTEGHDMETIQGALQLLAQSKISLLQFEYNHRWIYAKSFLRDVFIAIENMPYKIALLQSDHLLFLDEWHPELERFFEGNYAIVHKEAIHWFPSKNGSWDCFNTLVVNN